MNGFRFLNKNTTQVNVDDDVDVDVDVDQKGLQINKLCVHTNAQKISIGKKLFWAASIWGKNKRGDNVMKLFVPNLGRAKLGLIITSFG